MKMLVDLIYYWFKVNRVGNKEKRIARVNANRVKIQDYPSLIRYTVYPHHFQVMVYNYNLNFQID